MPQPVNDALLRANARIGEELIAILQKYAGERGGREGSAATLTRIIQERDHYRAIVIAHMADDADARKRTIRP